MIYKLYRLYKTKRKKKFLSDSQKISSSAVISSRFNFSLIKNSLEVGDNSYLDGRFVTKQSGSIKIGSNCSFRSNTYIGSLNSVVIGNNVFGAEHVFICDNNNHPIEPDLRYAMTMDPPNTKKWKWDSKLVRNAPVVIEDNVWIGRYSMIMKGVKIGSGSIIAAGAVVTKSFPENSIIAGNPATLVKKTK